MPDAFGYVYDPLPPTTLDEAWLEFYATRNDPTYPRETLRSRSRLILHYAPIAKYVAYRVSAAAASERTLIAPALIALARAIDDRTDGDLEEWIPTLATLLAVACQQALDDPDA
jgi:hypothetical protein